MDVGPQAVEQIVEIFFTSSATQEFSSPEVRETFRERWLGRYLTYDPDWFYVAVREARVVGYLAGSIDDPAQTPRFADIGYFKVWASETAIYPAHLHVNVLATAREHGIGSKLIARFVEDLEAAGVQGVHLVTGRNSRNVAFYQRNGFKPVVWMNWNGSEVLMLGRRLTTSPTHSCP